MAYIVHSFYAVKHLQQIALRTALILSVASGVAIAPALAMRQDQNSSAPTADQAKNDKSDRAIMRKIRRSVVQDKSLSTDAHNVKIIAQHGKVTLRGPVNNADEKKTIEAKAAEVAGDGNVTSEITVKGDSK